jgi:ribosomal protein S18 acetylase RimI-like enzyme
MDSLRVWLEPEYDHGRTGAWLLDWPGAFTWGATRQAAIARSTSATHRFVDWLAAHGDAAPPVPTALAEVVEEVAAYRLADGYEVNATFAADDRVVDGPEVEAHLRRLGFAREDLLGVVDRIRQYESAGGELPLEERSAEAKASGARDEHTVDEVLRHLCGAETWFVSRLDPSARYTGSRDDTADYLASSRAFLAEGLRRLQASGNSGRTDSKGERWTLAKVLRRSLYHSLDHLDELERRLSLAEHRADRIEIRRDAQFDLAELRHLFASAGLLRRARDDDDLMRRTLAGSTETVSAWDGDDLVGFARIISDEATNGYISTVAVSPRWQDRGLGTRLMRALMEGRGHLKLALDARQGAEPFYERLGFARVTSSMVRPRASGRSP